MQFNATTNLASNSWPQNPRLQRTRLRAPLSRKPFGVSWT
jgi:hypothetical protein